MCSWCWAFSSALEKLLEKLPAEVGTKRLLAGLAPDSREPMPAQMRDYIRGQWRQIQRQIPGTRFNFDFWTRCVPRRSTYPACRAVIAARRQGESFDEAMTRAIQRAYYLQARNPSDTATLLELAGENASFEIPITQEELAGMVGASRERVNKAIASFIRLGWLEQNERTYRITQRDRLELRAR